MRKRHASCQGQSLGRPALACLLLILAVSCVAAQPSPGKRRLHRRAPAPSKQLSAGEVREFVSLATKAFAWSKSQHDSVRPAVAEEVADFFGLRAFRTEQFHRRAGQTNASTNLYAQAGMAFLSALDPKQRARLETLAGDQLAPLRQHAELHSRVLEQLQRGRVNFTDHEEAVIRAATERRRVEGAMALQQARGFRALSLSMSREQMDYLVNFRRGLTSEAFVGYGQSEAADLASHLKSLPGDARLRLLETAEEAFNWLTGSLAGNLVFDSSDIAPFFDDAASLSGSPLPATPPKDSGRTRYGKGKTGNPFEGLPGLLDWRQRRVVQGLLEEEKPLFTRFLADRKRLTSELYRLRTGESLDAAAVATLSSRLGETEGRIILLQAKTFGYLDNVFRPDQLARIVLPGKTPPRQTSGPDVATR